MNPLRIPPILARAASVAVVAALMALAPSAQARNKRLMESVPDTMRVSRAHEILGNLDLRFGGDSARGANLVRRDVVVKGVGTTRVHDVGQDDSVRPSDHDLCARAFEDAITQLAFAARGARATAIVGVVSNYEGKVFDDPTHFECHAGALKAAVTLRAQLSVGPVVTAPASEAPAVSPPPAPAVAPPVPPIAPPAPADVVPPPPPPTFQPLPPVPSSAPAKN
ncbi:MAG TPA: hypothetical protein VES00_21690 [Burkholderiaceae bacterium]|jgi:hypothetical protein|nr:hypothetical protein [Burkholderiaceae bacterium]